MDKQARPFADKIFVAKVALFLQTLYTIGVLAYARSPFEQNWVPIANAFLAALVFHFAWANADCTVTGAEARSADDLEDAFRVWAGRKHWFWASLGTLLLSFLTLIVFTCVKGDMKQWSIWYALLTVFAFATPWLSGSSKSVRKHHLPKKASGLLGYEYIVVETTDGDKHLLVGYRESVSVYKIGAMLPEHMHIMMGDPDMDGFRKITVTNAETGCEIFLGYF